MDRRAVLRNGASRDLQFEADDLLPLVDAAALLELVCLEEGDAILTASGEAFVAAPILARKELFRRRLINRPTVVTRIHAALVAKQNHRLPEAFFLDLLEEHFSTRGGPATARHRPRLGPLRRAVAFEDDTDELFLEPS